MKVNSLPIEFSSAYRFKKFIGLSSQRLNREIPQGINLSIGKCLEIKGVEQCDQIIINDLFRDLRPFSDYVQVFLHGSWADDTKTPFSDIDDYIILDIESLKQRNLLSKVFRILNKIDMEFCRIDPLQHHGHWIVDKRELQNYDNSFIPLHVLSESKVILGENFISGKINSKNSEEGLRKNVINTCRNVKILSDDFFNNSINSYQLKCLVGSFALMPAFISQLKGMDYNKPQAIKKANLFYSEEALSCIEWSTANRKNWGIITKSRKYKAFGLLARFCPDPHLWRKFSNKFSPKILKIDISQLSQVSLKKENVNLFISESLKNAH